MPSLTVLFPFLSGANYAYAQSEQKVHQVQAEFVPENGCPAALTGAKAELDVDPFGAPIDARIYLSYKNASAKPIAAVKFRVRFIDNNGKDLGTFQAPDGALLDPGQERTQKWKTEHLYPGIEALKVRVLLVKYADGELWESAKLPEIPAPAQPTGADPNSQK